MDKFINPFFQRQTSSLHLHWATGGYKGLHGGAQGCSRQEVLLLTKHILYARPPSPLKLPHLSFTSIPSLTHQVFVLSLHLLFSCLSSLSGFCITAPKRQEGEEGDCGGGQRVRSTQRVIILSFSHHDKRLQGCWHAERWKICGDRGKLKKCVAEGWAGGRVGASGPYCASRCMNSLQSGSLTTFPYLVFDITVVFT